MSGIKMKSYESMNPKKDCLYISIPGNPKALKRHRHYKVGNFVKTYDPSSADKSDFLVLAMANKPSVPFNEPLEVTFTFAFPRPKSHYRTGKNAHLLKDSAPFWHTSKPDTDNLIKFVCDSLNGVFWKDDSCICKINAIKIYSETPETVLDVEKINYPF